MNHNDAAELCLILIFNRCLPNIRPQTWPQTWKCGSPVVLINLPAPRIWFTRAHYTSALVRSMKGSRRWRCQCNAGVASALWHHTPLIHLENVHRKCNSDGHTKTCGGSPGQWQGPAAERGESLGHTMFHWN